jgi:hypothetical protein
VGAYADQAARREAPGAGVPFTAGNGAAGTPVDLSAYRGQYMSLKFPGKAYVRFGPSSAAAAAVTTTDYYLTTDAPEDFVITDDRIWGCAYGVGGAHAGVAAPTGR